MMDQEDKNVEYVSFNDTFMPGTDGKRIKLQPDNLEQFKSTVRNMFKIVSIAEGNNFGITKEQVEEKKEQVNHSSMNEEVKQRELNALDAQADILESVDVKTSELVDINRLFNVSSKLLSLTPEILAHIETQAIDEEKLEDWNKKSEEQNIVPLQQEISPETVQAAIDEVQSAFDSVLEKAKENQPEETEEQDEDQEEWTDEKIAKLFGGFSPNLEPKKEEKKQEEPSLASKVEEEANKKLAKEEEVELPKVKEEAPKRFGKFASDFEEEHDEVAPKEVPSSTFHAVDLADYEEDSIELPPVKKREKPRYDEIEEEEDVKEELPEVKVKPIPKGVFDMRKPITHEKEHEDFFGTLPNRIAERLKLDTDILEALSTLGEEEDKTESLNLTKQGLITKRDNEERKLAESEQQLKEAKQSKVDAAEEATLNAKKQVMEAIRLRIQSAKDKNAEIEQTNQSIVTETVRLSENVADNTSAAMQYNAEAKNLRSRLGRMDWSDLAEDILAGDTTNTVETRRRGGR